MYGAANDDDVCRCANAHPYQRNLPCPPPFGEGNCAYENHENRRQPRAGLCCVHAPEKVTLDNTDFTDVAAVVITVAESCSGILALLKRTGFQLPVFIFSQEPMDVPEGAIATITGKAQEFLELSLPPAVTKRTCYRHFLTP